MSSRTISVRVSPEVEDRLARLAAATSRSKSYLAAEAIEEYLALQEWQVGAILDGVGEADDSRGADIADVRARWELRLANPTD